MRAEKSTADASHPLHLVRQRNMCRQWNKEPAWLAATLAPEPEWLRRASLSFSGFLFALQESVMYPAEGDSLLTFHQINRADLESVTVLDFDPAQLDRFLGPLADVVAAVRAGLAHSLVALQLEDVTVGFYVVHPDRRDASCWWLGWLAIDRHHQGHGFGRIAMARIMAVFRRIAGCRRARLLVAPDNAHAVKLYARSGFQPVGVHSTGELIFEATLPHLFIAGMRLTTAVRLLALPGHTSHEGRLRLAAGPYAARMIGVERGPPGPSTLAA